MKLQAMLIDDELPILHNLKQVIPWEAMNVEVRLARNGQEALNMARACMPDIILCDIRMPVMDGLAFVQEIRRLSSDCEILLITGYEQFEYAKIALRYGVRDYISKPINYEQLKETVLGLAERIRSKKQEARNEQRKWSRIANLANEKMLLDILMGFSSFPPYSLACGEEQAQEDPAYAIMLAGIHDYAKVSLKWNKQESKLWNFAVKNVLQDLSDELWSDFAAVQTKEGEWCIVIPFVDGSLPLKEEEAVDLAEKLRLGVRQHLKFDIRVGIHPGPIKAEELAEAYQTIQWSLANQPVKEPFIYYYAEPEAGSHSARSGKKSVEMWMLSAKDYIERHLSSDFGIEDVANHLGISSSYFCLLFKNYFGETFVEYVTKQRIELAKSYLIQSDRSVRQIGQQVGYMERRYFTKVFQKYTGITPSQYRERKACRTGAEGC